jgi:hypothetical protein
MIHKLSMQLKLFSYNLYYVKWPLKKEACPTGVSLAGKNAWFLAWELRVCPI